MWFICLLACYGLIFGIQNKMPFLRNRFCLLDKMLDCSYCLGYWAGWGVWAVTWLVIGVELIPAQNTIWARGLSGLIWAFSSAAFCYMIDVIMYRLEGFNK